MTYGSLEAERELTEPAPRRVAGPLACSMLLHGVILFLFARHLVVPSAAALSSEERASVRVIVAARPLPVPPEAPALEIDENIAADIAPPTAPGAGIDEPVATPPAATEGGIVEASLEETDVGIAAWSPARIRAAVQDSSSALRSARTEAWIAGCIIERRQRHTRDCEEQMAEPDYLSPNAVAGRTAGAAAFSAVTRPQRHGLLVEQFMQENAALDILMEQEGVLGTLAADRYYLNREQIVYLTGNRGDLVFGPMQNFAADVLAGPSLSLAGNVPFQCSKWRSGYAIGEKRKATGAPAPCVYEFTGFVIDRPEPEVDPTAFRVVPITLGNQR